MNLSACPDWLKLGGPDHTLDHVGVVIEPNSTSPHGHVGLVYRERGEIRFLHLAWHYVLSQDQLQGAWVISPLVSDLAMLVAARCRRIARSFGDAGLPYAPRFLASKFDDRGALVLGDGEHGFTCATFVLAVFHHAGLPLVHVDDWPVREEDATFRDKIIEILTTDLLRLRTKLQILEQVGDPAVVERLRKRESDLAQHIENIKAEPIAARFRPEEVAAASSLPDRPSAFEPVAERSRVIVEQLVAPR